MIKADSIYTIELCKVLTQYYPNLCGIKLQKTNSADNS